MRGVTIFSVALIAICCSSMVSSKALICYFSSWAVYRQGPGNYNIENIDPNLCTHVIYSFISLRESGELALMDSWMDEQLFDKMHNLLLAKNPSLKLMLAVGGWTAGPYAFQTVVVDPARRAVMVQSAVDLLKKYNFHGLDIDWEYQDHIGGKPEHRDGLTALCNELRARFNQEGFVLTMAMQASFALTENDYDLPALSKSLDYFNVMSYDFHGPWETVTGHGSPLYPANDEEGADREFSVESVINNYIARGADPAKVLIGIPVFGHTFTLADPNNHGRRAPTTGAGAIGDTVPEGGVLAYSEYCRTASQWTKYMLDDQAVPYAVKGDQWFGLEDVASVQRKMEFARSKGLGGAIIWSLETDDHSNVCGQGTNPIITAVKNAL